MLTLIYIEVGKQAKLSGDCGTTCINFFPVSSWDTDLMITSIQNLNLISLGYQSITNFKPCYLVTMLLRTGFNNVVLLTLLKVVNNIDQCCYTAGCVVCVKHFINM